ncbi:MAG: 30S ribosomal protein S12 methylthiotransferase RimO [Elusimicrobia bacterium]|nr:30S ribosomal protein S12 methylthiotransferase RimO [Elusimicrobiota bacterium]
MKKVSFISLGCPKNLVDTEVIAGIFGSAGFSFASSPRDSEFVVINTCSFIKQVRAESSHEIERICSDKRKGQKIIVCGCLPQMEGRNLFDKFPKIDALVGSADFPKIGRIIEKLENGRKIAEIGIPRFIYNSEFPRFISTAPSYAYVKIAEGCSNNCSYCRIPQLRGNFRIRRVSDIVLESRQIASMGVKEIILVANDVSSYGMKRLKSLLGELEKIRGIKWIRLLYLHPAHITKSLIKFVKNSKKICRYFDIPLQHTSDGILAKMNRPPFSKAENLINFIRDEIPDAAIRTSLIVGFPGEKREQFGKLLKDVKKLKFDWLGVFTYSEEKGTPAARLKNKVGEKKASLRAKEIMRVQKKITFEKNKKFVGKEIEVLVDSPFSGHAEFQAPGIDGKVIFEKKQIPGKSVRIKIKRTAGYDLVA